MSENCVSGKSVLPSEGLETVIEQGDVIIDFTFHKATMEFARLAAKYRKAMVIGTTGLSQENLEELQDLAAKISLCSGPEYVGLCQCPLQTGQENCCHSR